MQRLEGKVAFLTGAGSGIAKATALAFAREGAKVAIVEINGPLGEDTAREIRAFSDDVVFLQTDVTQEAGVRDAVEATVTRFGKLDVLFNCAGGSDVDDGPLHEMRMDVWQRTIALNLLHPLLCCRFALPHMMRNGSGSIVNVSSHTSLMGSVRPLYAAAKGGINAFTRTLAAQYARFGIRANTLASGTVRSERLVKRYENKDSQLADVPSPQAAERNALHQLYPFSVGEPADMAAVALFLASDESRMINGATIAADGGRSSYLRVSLPPQ